MKLQHALAAVAVALAATPALAASPSTVLLDFESPTSFSSIAGFYAGGTDGAGVTGPSLGVNFGPDALAIRNDPDFPNFSNAPSPVGVMTAVGPDAALNFATGFSALSFHYSSTDAAAGGVKVWSGLGGNGTLLASFDLAANAQAGCSDTAFCHFDQLSGNFAAAQSITFAASGIGYDDIAVTPVPGPAPLLFVGVGLAALLRRRRAA